VVKRFSGLSLSAFDRIAARTGAMWDESVNTVDAVRGFLEWAGALANGKWYGDRCGCPDDRCAGYHHSKGVDAWDCGCLDALLSSYLRERTAVAA